MKTSNSKLLLLFILIIFFFSGASALFYQIVWQRIMTVYYGVGFYSITLIVSIYMLGLGLGGFLGGIIAERFKSKVKTYLLIEIAIGLFGVLSPFILDSIGKLTAGISYGPASIIIFLFLIIPTTLMGTTLPLLIKIYNELNKNFFNSISMLYFINTLGAAFGTIFTSFILISLFGLLVPIYIAAAINLIIGVAVFLFIKPKMEKSEMVVNADVPIAATVNSKFFSPIFIIVFITGFIAIGYELVWFRLINVITKDSPYSFSSVLFIYLLGLAVGSFYIKRFSFANPRSVFFLLQAIIGIYVLIMYFLFYRLSSHSATFSSLIHNSFDTMIHPDFRVWNIHNWKSIFSSLDIFIWPFILFFIPSVCLGACFPLITSFAVGTNLNYAAITGRIYFFNVLGNVLGGLITGFILLPLMKTIGTTLLFSLVNICFIFFVPLNGWRKKLLPIKYIAFPGIMLLSVIYFPSSENFYKAIHSDLTHFVNVPANFNYNSFYEEGMESVNMVYQKDKIVYKNFINGSGHAYRPGYVFFNEVLEAVSYSKTVDNALVIGFGAGSTTEALLRDPLVKKVTLVEINRPMLKNLAKVKEVQEILSNPKLNVIVDDGRRFLYQTSDTFDLVCLDPLRTSTAYSNNIHSADFFELIKKHLKADGVVMCGGGNRVLQNTAMSQFNFARVYDWCIVGSMAKITLDSINRNSYLSEFNAEELKGMEGEKVSYIGDKETLTPQYSKLPVNTDWHPHSEYFIWRSERLQTVSITPH